MQKRIVILVVGLVTVATTTNINNVEAYTNTNCNYNRYSDSISCTSYDPNASFLLKTQAEILMLQVEADLAKSKRADQRAANNYQQYLTQHASDKATDRFTEVFGREPNNAEFNYWFNRIQQESFSHEQVKEKMAYYKATGRTMPAVATPKVAGASTSALAPKINAIFRSAYTRNPSVSENHYWLSRIKNKPTEQALRDAMLFHKGSGLNH